MNNVVRNCKSNSYCSHCSYSSCNHTRFGESIVYSLHIVIERLEQKIENKVHALVTFKKYHETRMLLDEVHKKLELFESEISEILDGY